jgi:hypothetical protein
MVIEFTTTNTIAKRKRIKGQTTIYKTLQKTKDRAKRTPLKIMGELMYSGRVGSSCSTIPPISTKQTTTTSFTSIFLAAFKDYNFYDKNKI